MALSNYEDSLHIQMAKEHKKSSNQDTEEIDDYPENPPGLIRMDSTNTANTLNLASHRESRIETFRNS